MMEIDLKLLRSFVEVQERRSLTRAAEALACTQAAMSMRLKMLEEIVGERLFLRQRHGLLPTPRADELYAAAIGVLAAYDEMISAARAAAVRPKVRIGAPDDYALGIVGPAFAGLSGPAAAMDIELACDLSANLAAAVRRGELDLALVTLAAAPAKPLAAWEVDLRWLAAPGRVWEKDRPVDLAAYPEGCVFRAAMVAALDADGRAWRVAMQSRSHAGVMAAVRSGRAVTAVARATGPGDLIEVGADAGLPPLGRAPIHLIAPDRPMPKPVRLVESLVRARLDWIGRPPLTPAIA